MKCPNMRRGSLQRNWPYVIVRLLNSSRLNGTDPWSRTMLRVIAMTIALGCCISTSAYASTLPPIQLNDEQGKPVADAVVTAPGSKLQNPQRVFDDNGAIMDQKDLQFAPQVLVIKPNTKVNFPNSDDTRHHVYSFSEAKTFELPLYNANDADPVLFDKEGIVKLGCNIHDQMRGYIIVTSDPVLGVSDADGHIGATEFVGSVPTQIVVWHPLLNQALTLAVEQLASDSDKNVLNIKLPIVVPDDNDQQKTSLKNRLKRYKRGS